MEFRARTYAIVVTITSILALLLLPRLGSFVWFLVGSLLWSLMLFVLARSLRSRAKELRSDHLVLVVSMALSFLGLILLIESNGLRIFLAFLCALMLGLLYHHRWYHTHELVHQEKPFRRIKMMLWVFTSFALTSLIFAINLFFPNVPFWSLALLGGIWFGFVSVFIWRLYYHLPLYRFGLWAGIVGLIMVEFIWVAHILPLGYLSLALLVTWPWYIAQLFIRFHMSARGIIWKKQSRFLITNLVLYTLTVLFMRWI